MTKQEILDRFKDINEAYNDSSRYDSLSRMLDDLLKEQEEDIQDLRRENHNILTQFHEWAKEQDAVEPTWQQGKAYCGSCGKRIPLKIGARYCHKCGKPILWDGR